MKQKRQPPRTRIALPTLASVTATDLAVLSASVRSMQGRFSRADIILGTATYGGEEQAVLLLSLPACFYLAMLAATARGTLAPVERLYAYVQYLHAHGSLPEAEDTYKLT